jgi:hypothetical protein
MMNIDVLTFQEFIVNEPLPLSTIHRAVLEFLRNRNDVVLFGAQAVNAYVDEPRMTQDVDLMALNAADIAEELRKHLADRFRIAVRVREVGGAKGYRLYQIQKDANRHLVDIRPTNQLPIAQRINQVLVMSPAELIASKVISYYQRRGKPKSGTDWRDLALLLLAFPELKDVTGAVTDCLLAAAANPAIQLVWIEIVNTPISASNDEDEFDDEF